MLGLDFKLKLIITVVLTLAFGWRPVCQAHERLQRSTHFGVVYLTQWSFYLISQQETIDRHGSFHNWSHNLLKTRFDRDYHDYNVLKHTLAGYSYYMFYRTRGYGQMEAFGWTFLSSLAFEYTIETYTEPPSVQDIYITPVYGTALAMGAEHLSRQLYRRGSWWSRALAYILNPFVFIPCSSYQWSVGMQIRPEYQGALLQVRF